MKQLTSAIFILIFFAAVISSCAKKDEFQECLDNPECEYFRCKVDGKLWRPECESSFLGCDAVDVQYYRDLNGGGLEILAANDLKESGFNLDVIGVNEINKEYNFLFTENIKPIYWDKLKYSSIFIDDTMQNSFIVITKLDTSKFIIEGQFEYYGINEEGIRIEATSGEFRQQYRF